MKDPLTLDGFLQALATDPVCRNGLLFLGALILFAIGFRIYCEHQFARERFHREHARRRK